MRKSHIFHPHSGYMFNWASYSQKKDAKNRDARYGSWIIYRSSLLHTVVSQKTRDLNCVLRLSNTLSQRISWGMFFIYQTTFYRPHLRNDQGMEMTEKYDFFCLADFDLSIHICFSFGWHMSLYSNQGWQWERWQGCTKGDCYLFISLAATMLDWHIKELTILLPSFHYRFCIIIVTIPWQKIVSRCFIVLHFSFITFLSKTGRS